MSENPWKTFPNHKPLKSGLYRVEYDCADHHWYQCWYWDDDAWVEENFRGCLIHLQNKRNIRFKPWDDGETDESKVVLTLDEAKFLKHRVLKATNFRGSLNLTEEEIDMFDAIEKRIEESETT